MEVGEVNFPHGSQPARWNMCHTSNLSFLETLSPDETARQSGTAVGVQYLAPSAPCGSSRCAVVTAV
jgi:hypothetical protein